MTTSSASAARRPNHGSAISSWNSCASSTLIFLDCFWRASSRPSCFSVLASASMTFLSAARVFVRSRMAWLSVSSRPLSPFSVASLVSANATVVLRQSASVGASLAISARMPSAPSGAGSGRLLIVFATNFWRFSFQSQ